MTSLSNPGGEEASVVTKAGCFRVVPRYLTPDGVWVEVEVNCPGGVTVMMSPDHARALAAGLERAAAHVAYLLASPLSPRPVPLERLWREPARGER